MASILSRPQCVNVTYTFHNENARYTQIKSECCLAHWGQVTHICVGNLTIIMSDNGLSPGRCQAIIRTNAGMLFFKSLGTNFGEILIEIHAFAFKKMHLKTSSAKWRPFCHGLNMLNISRTNDANMWPQNFNWSTNVLNNTSNNATSTI